MSNPVNKGVPVGKVPADTGAGCLRPSDPAIASTGIMSRYRPTSMHNAPTVLNQCVSPLSPPNAEPLLLACDANAYVISVSPWGPSLVSDASAGLSTTDAAANVNKTSGTKRM